MTPNPWPPTKRPRLRELREGWPATPVQVALRVPHPPAYPSPHTHADAHFTRCNGMLCAAACLSSSSGSSSRPWCDVAQCAVTCARRCCSCMALLWQRARSPLSRLTSCAASACVSAQHSRSRPHSRTATAHSAAAASPRALSCSDEGHTEHREGCFVWRCSQLSSATCSPHMRRDHNMRMREIRYARDCRTRCGLRRARCGARCACLSY